MANLNSSSESTTPVFGGKSAVILGVLFLVVFAVFAVFGALDRAHRARLETIQPAVQK